MMHMQMTFYNSCEVTLWVPSLTSSTVGEYVVLLVLMIGFAIVHEAIYKLRQLCSAARLHGQRDVNVSPASTSAEPLMQATRSSARSTSPQRVAGNLVTASSGLVVPALYGVNLVTSYLLMLAVMTYNVGILLVTCCGMAMGHWWFQCRGKPTQEGQQDDSLSDACCPPHS
eukprot:jgi/Ulvmu1/8743/UM047_0085.1